MKENLNVTGASLAKITDIWQLRATALSVMLELLDVDTSVLMSGDQDMCMAYLLRSGVIHSIDPAFELSDLIDLLQTPINGVEA